MPFPHAQAPLRQLSARASQLEQAVPPVPHDEIPGVVRHWLLLQQPLAQLCALHTQLPFTQAWPGAHMALVPQAQAPLTQASARVASQALHAAPAPQTVSDMPDVPTHAPALQHWFPLHASQPAQTLLLHAPLHA